MARSTRKKNLSRLALNLRSYRDRIGWTQTELGEAAEVSQSTIASLEIDRWKNPRLYPLVNIADAFKVSLDELIGRTLPGADNERYLQEFLDSPWSSSGVVSPTAEELDWVRRLPPATWMGRRPTARDIAELIQWRRGMTKTEA
jgi:transcriptional regulator with XRE-family HTH domain